MALGTKSVELRTGGKLTYVEQGDPSGIPVLLLHGITDSWRSFEDVLPTCRIPSTPSPFRREAMGTLTGPRQATVLRTSPPTLPLSWKLLGSGQWSSPVTPWVLCRTALRDRLSRTHTGSRTCRLTHNMAGPPRFRGALGLHCINFQRSN